MNKTLILTGLAVIAVAGYFTYQQSTTDTQMTATEDGSISETLEQAAQDAQQTTEGVYGTLEGVSQDALDSAQSTAEDASDATAEMVEGVSEEMENTYEEIAPAGGPTGTDTMNEGSESFQTQTPTDRTTE